MERAFIWVFDHATLVFTLMMLVAAAIIVRIGRPRRWFHWAGDVLLGGALLLAAAGLIFFTSIHSALARRIDSIAFTTAGNGAVHRISDYRGKVVVLNIWATWCPPCRAEMPDLNRIANKWQGRDVVVLTLSDETWDAIGRYTSRFPMRTTVGHFTSARPRTSLEALAFRGRPTTLVLDRAGRVRQQLIGMRDYASFDNAIRAAL